MPTGVGGAAVRLLRAIPVSAWVESVADRRIVPTVEGAKAHDAVTEAALATGITPLPARFGQVFETDDACIAALQAQAARLLADLAAVQGLVEMRVVIAMTLDGPAVATAEPPTTPGRAYMDQLVRSRGRDRMAEDAGRRVREAVSLRVGALVRREAFAIAGSPPVLTLSHLVARADVTRYRAALDDAAFVGSGGRFVICGPVAPYQFATPPT